MNKMKIAVCVKPVPDPDYYSRITVDKKTKRLQRDMAPTILNSLDRNALEKAFQIKDEYNAEVTVFSMAPPNTKETLLETLAMGADEIVLLSDATFGGADTLATAHTLSQGIKNTDEFSLVLMGNESSDGGTNQVAAQLGELLGIPRFTNVSGLKFSDPYFEVTAAANKSIYTYEVTAPLLCGVVKEIAVPRYATLIGIKYCMSKPFTVLCAEDGFDKVLTGSAGSPTKAGDIFEKENRKQAIMLEGTPDEITDRILVEMKKAGIISLSGGE